jgi:tRNA modification GTPase
MEATERAALERAREAAERERTVVVLNKCDLEPDEGWQPPHPSVLKVSALTGAGIDRLREALKERLIGAGPLEDPIITDARHARAIGHGLESLQGAAAALQAGLTEEIVLEDLRSARRALGEISGEFTGEDLYDRIFATFCIGK